MTRAMNIDEGGRGQKRAVPVGESPGRAGGKGKWLEANEQSQDFIEIIKELKELVPELKKQLAHANAEIVNLKLQNQSAAPILPKVLKVEHDAGDMVMALGGGYGKGKGAGAGGQGGTGRKGGAG